MFYSNLPWRGGFTFTTNIGKSRTCSFLPSNKDLNKPLCLTLLWNILHILMRTVAVWLSLRQSPRAAEPPDMNPPPTYSHFFRATSHFWNVHSQLSSLRADWLCSASDVAHGRLKYRSFEAAVHAGCLSMCLQNVTMPTLRNRSAEQKDQNVTGCEKTNQIFFWLNVSSPNWSLQRKPGLMFEILWSSWRLHVRGWHTAFHQ